eukprot:TRINITY_DN8719_c0_g5_i1.p1 TRINITY_DN8719_c0_g5~~TRINITY_DN8719_c0_g5_i1.p1  ORF type:complete len:3387 (+),score=808.47 TRINITY_DN8719_c0_g5_i1:93-10253(+)
MDFPPRGVPGYMRSTLSSQGRNPDLRTTFADDNQRGRDNSFEYVDIHGLPPAAAAETGTTEPFPNSNTTSTGNPLYRFLFGGQPVKQPTVFEQVLQQQMEAGQAPDCELLLSTLRQSSLTSADLVPIMELLRARRHEPVWLQVWALISSVLPSLGAPFRKGVMETLVSIPADVPLSVLLDPVFRVCTYCPITLEQYRRTANNSSEYALVLLCEALFKRMRGQVSQWSCSNSKQIPGILDQLCARAADTLAAGFGPNELLSYCKLCEWPIRDQRIVDYWFSLGFDAASYVAKVMTSRSAVDAADLDLVLQYRHLFDMEVVTSWLDRIVMALLHPTQCTLEDFLPLYRKVLAVLPAGTVLLNMKSETLLMKCYSIPTLTSALSQLAAVGMSSAVFDRARLTVLNIVSHNLASDEDLKQFVCALLPASSTQAPPSSDLCQRIAIKVARLVRLRSSPAVSFFTALSACRALADAEVVCDRLAVDVFLPTASAIFDAFAIALPVLVRGTALRQRSPSCLLMQLWRRWCHLGCAPLMNKSATQRSEALLQLAVALRDLPAETYSCVAVLVNKVLKRAIVDIVRPSDALVQLIELVSPVHQAVRIPRLQRYEASLRAIIDRVESAELNRRELQTLVDNGPGLERVCRVLGSDFTATDAAELLENFNITMEEVQNYFMILHALVLEDLFPRDGVYLKAQELKGQEMAKLSELIAVQDEVRRKFAELRVDDTLYQFMHYFMLKGSKLFSKLLHDRNRRTDIDLPSALASVNELLQKVLSLTLDEATLSRILDVFKSIDISAEVEVLVAYPPYHAIAGSVEETHRIMTTLRQDFTLFSYFTSVPGVLRTVERLELVPASDEDYLHLRGIRGSLDDNQEQAVNLRELDGTYPRLRELFHDFGPFDLQLILLAADCSTLIQWLSTFSNPAQAIRFERLKEQLTLYAQDAREAQLLDSAIEARTLLAPFMCPSRSLRELFNLVRQLGVSQEAEVSRVRDASLCIQTIQALFERVQSSSFVSAQAELAKLHDRGSLVARLEVARGHQSSRQMIVSAADGRSGFVEFKDEVQTNDLLRQLTYASAIAESDAQRAQIQEFLSLSKALIAQYEMYCQLERAAHPNFQARVLSDPLQGSVENADANIRSLEATLNAWRTELQLCTGRTPLLQLWAPGDILNVIRLLSRDSTRRVFIELLLGQVEWNQIGRDQQEEELAVQCIQAKMQLFTGLANLAPGVNVKTAISDAMFTYDRAQHNCTMLALERVERLVQTVFIPEPFAARQAGGGGQYAMRACQDQPVLGLLGAILAPYVAINRPPLSQELLYCSKRTMVDELEQFFARVRTFQRCRFVLVGVDLLNEAARAVVYKCQHELRTTMHADVFYLYIEAAFSATSWLVAFDAPALSLKKRLPASFPASPSITAVSGIEGVGKTHFLQARCREATHQSVMIAINDSVDVHYVIQSLSRLNPYVPAVIGLNISPCSPELDVNRLLLDLLVVGVVHDPRTGSTCRVRDATNWQFFVEVPHRRDAPSGSCVPIAQAVGNRQVLGSTYPLEITDEVRYVCRFLLAYDIGTIDKKHAPNVAWPDLGHLTLMMDVPSDSQCRELLSKYLRLPDSRKLHEVSCVKYLANRFKMFFECPFFTHAPAYNRHEAMQTKLRMITNLTSRKIDPLSQAEATAQATREISAMACPHIDRLGSLMVEQFLREAAAVCAPRRPGGADDEEHLLHGVHVVADSHSRPTLLYNSDDDLRRVQELAALMNSGIEDLQALDTQDPSGVMRQEAYLAWLMTLPVDQVRTLLRKYNFVMIPRFTARFGMLHQRKLARLPVFVESDSGQGKTFLMQRYADLVNLNAIHSNDENIAPMLIRRLCRWLRAVVLPILVEVRAANAATAAAEADADQEQTLTSNVTELERRLAAEEFDYAGLERLWVELLDVIPFERRIFAKLGDHLETLLSVLPMLTATDRLTDLLLIVSQEKQGDAVAEIGAEQVRIRDRELGGPQASVSLLKEFLQLGETLKPLFYYKLLHLGTTQRELLDFLEPIFLLAREQALRSYELVVMFDEPNTSRQQGLIKEIMMDHSCLGRPVPPNIFFVCAVNPLLKPSDMSAIPTTDLFARSAIDTVVHRAHYHVFPLPPSLNHMLVRFAPPTEVLLKRYIENKIALFVAKNPRNVLVGSLVSQFTRLLMCAHQFFIRHFGHSSVSQRDIARVFHFTAYLLESGILGQPGDVPNTRLRRALMTAVALAYYFRLPVSPLSDREDEQEQQAKVLRSVLADELSAAMDVAGFNFAAEIDTVVNQFSCPRNFVIPPGIALNQALRENLMAAVICIQCRVPLGIFGRPGTTKTYAVRFAVDSMKGEQSTTEFCRRFAAVDLFWIQGSSSATSADIKMWFHRAMDRQRTYDAQEKSRIQRAERAAASGLPVAHDYSSSRRCLIVLDEASLTREDKQVLKVLHEFLDNRDVSFICIANVLLDTANTNRMMVLRRTMAPETDLYILAKGCLGLADHVLSEEHDSMIRGLCAGYSALMLDEEFCHMYHDRDFIYMLRHLHVAALNEHHEVSFSPMSVLRALEANFRGIEARFGELMEKFFAVVSVSIERNFPLPPLEEFASAEQSMIANIRRPPVNPAHVVLQPRFTMVIDDSEDNSAVPYVYKLAKQCLHAGQEVRVFSLSDFPEDMTDLRDAEVISAVRWCMEQPITVILVNATRIANSFLDVANQNYTVMTDAEGAKMLYSSVAIGPVTYGCKIHPEFQMVVHMPKRLLPLAQAPLLSRYAKFEVNVHNMYKCALLRFSESDREMIEATMRKCYQLVDAIGAARLIGYTSNTLPALMLSHMNLECEPVSYIPFATAKAKLFADEGDLTSVLQAMVRGTAVHLLQLCPPEVMTSVLEMVKREIAPTYGQLYFRAQEHFDISALVRELNLPVVAGSADVMRFRRKQLVQVRTSSDVLDLAHNRLDSAVSKSTIVCQLSRMPSQHRFLKLLDKFVRDSSKRTLIVVVEHKTTQSSNHINMVRHLIDSAVEGAPTKNAIVMVHMRPDLLYSQRGYASIFVNDWDFRFFDTVYKSVELPTVATAMCTPIDAADAIDNEPLAPHKLQRVLNEFVSRATCINAPEGLGVNASKFYSPTASVSERVEGLQAVLEKYPQIIEQAMLGYYQITSRSKLFKMLRELATEMLTGQKLSSFSSLVETRLQGDVLKVFGVLMGQICSEYGLASLENAADSACMQAVVPSVLRLIDTTGSGVDDKVRLAGSSGVYAVVLSHIIFARLESLADTAPRQLSAVERAQLMQTNADARLAHLLDVLQGHHGIEFTRQYALDFAKRVSSINAPDIPSSIFARIGEWLLMECPPDIPGILYLHSLPLSVLEGMEVLVSASRCVGLLGQELPALTGASRHAYTQVAWQAVFTGLWRS